MASVSLITEKRLSRLIATGDMQGSYVWNIPPNFPILPGLDLCPDMPLSEYVGLLAKMPMHLKG
jgi:hypothetical protein